MAETSSGNWDETDQSAVRAQVDRILNSDAFKQSKRRQRFLAFIVDETLAGRHDRLKSYTIATQVFDRPDTFDPLVDPVVRIEAGRLRDKLRQYYADGGADDPICIDLPKGGYVPSIDFRQDADGYGSSERPAPDLRRGVPRSIRSVSPRALTIAAAALFAMLASLALWHGYEGRSPPPGETVAGEARKGPVIAVLPFVNLGGDPEQKYFSDGLTEDILIALSRTPDLYVLSRDDTFHLDAKPQLAQLEGALKADYVLEGSVRRSGSRLRVTAQLVDTRSGRHVWADRFDREMSDVLVVQDEIVGELVAKLSGGYGAISVAEGKLATRKNADQVEAYDLILRAQDVLRPEWNRDAFGKAKALLERAVRLDPSSARAHRELSYLATIGSVFHLDEDPMTSDAVTALAVKATKLDPSDARAHLVAASAYFWSKQLDLFEAEAKQALTLAPYDAEILASIGCMIAKSGQWQRGVAMVEKAHALNAAAASGWYEATMAMHAYMNGDYERALAMMRQSPDQHTFYAYIDYIAIYGQLGRQHEARAAWNELVAQEPGTTRETIALWFASWNTSAIDSGKLMDGVTKSGVLDGVD